MQCSIPAFRNSIGTSRSLQPPCLRGRPMTKRSAATTPEIRVLFRYRNMNADTLEEHKKIIKDKKACWWGWWKRPREPRRFEVWNYLEDELKKHDEVMVGLFDSGAEKPSVSVRLARIKG